MDSFSFAPQQHMRTVAQRDYIFVDEHNRHKRPKVSRACRNCRKRRTRCETAKTDTWPCSQCIGLKIECVLPNGSGSRITATTPLNPSDENQQTSMPQQQISNIDPGTRYATRPAYPDAGGASCRAVPYESSQQPGSIPCRAASPPASMMQQSYASENVFPTPITQREFYTEFIRFFETVGKIRSRPELEKQLSVLRQALFEDVQESFVLKSACPSGSHSSSPRGLEPFWPVVRRPESVDQHLGTSDAQRVIYTSQLITPPISAGPEDRKGDCPVVQSPVLMSQETQAPGMLQRMPFTDQPGRNPSSIFEQRNTTFGTPTHSHSTTTPSQTSPLNSSSSDATEVPTIHDTHTVQASVPTDLQQSLPSQNSTAHVPNFVTPAMRQEFTASFYEGGTNQRPWDYDGQVLE